MKRKILVAVSGLTPQIITETVFALYNNHQWIPEQIVVLTTLTGEAKIQQDLLGENGQLARLCADYDLPKINLKIKHIGSDNLPFDDIRSEAENNATADLIVREIYRLCQDEDTELHVSIAGGRKTMGFYIGYALSLFGRVQDKMSHVLVEKDFEQNREFFYPPKHSQMIKTADGTEKDAANAKIMLAEIPFVRMAKNQQPFHLNDDFTFSQVVEQTQNVLNQNHKMIFDVANCTVRIGDLVDIVLPAEQFCVYAMVAHRSKSGKSVHFFDDETTQSVVDDYMVFYGHDKDNIERQYERNALIRKTHNRMKIKRIVQEQNSKIKKILRKELGVHGENHFAIQSKGTYRKTEYYLDIAPDLIEIVMPK